MSWTPEQERAIKSRDGNILVSASAGSGKTAVLTERAFQLIKENVDLSELLVLTFTDNAAAVMRERIREKLLNAGLFEYASNIDSVAIQTFDAFFLNLVKEFHYKMDIGKNVKIVEDSIIDVERLKILDELLDEYYSKSKPKDVFTKYIYKNCLKNDEELKTLILVIDAKLNLLLDRASYYKNYESTYYNEDFINKAIEDCYLLFIKRLENLKRNAFDLENPDYYDAFIAVIDNFLAAKDYDELCEKVAEGYTLPRAAGKYKLDDDDKALKKSLVNDLKEILGELQYGNSDEVKERYFGVKDDVKLLLEIAYKLNDRISLFKFQYNAFQFADIARLAYELVKLPDVNEIIKKRYKYIMVDEYQDTSDIQDAFLSAISNNNIFVVGDVKQSIYAFRNANPKIFLSKYEALHKSGDTHLHILKENFRSRKEIIDGNNKIFENLMLGKESEINYRDGHKMNYLSGFYDNFESKENHSFTALTYSYSVGKENEKREEKEARLIASDILNKIESGYLVLSDDKKSMRKATFRDFAILTRNKTHFDTYQRIFNEYQIPLFAKTDFKISENDLSYVFKNLVLLFDHYRRNDFEGEFKHRFISIMRSFLIEESDELVYQVASSENYELSKVDAKMRRVLELSEYKSIREINNDIVDAFEIYQNLFKIGDIRKNIYILFVFLNIGVALTDMHFEYDAFADHFLKSDYFNIEKSVNNIENFSDSVELSSIHGSKGMEFKIVYFAELYSHIKKDHGHFLVDNTYGVDLPNPDFKYPYNITRTLIQNKGKQESKAEELRIFYVALTRVMEKGIFILNEKFFEKNVYYFDACKSYQDFLSLSCFKFDVDKVEVRSKGLEAKSAITSNDKIEIRTLPVISDYSYFRHRPSRIKDNNVSKAAINRGIKYHRYLELVDFKTKDVSFIKNVRDREIIKRVLANNIFAHLKNAKIFKEYEFSDEVNNLSGVIDLLICYKDHIDIIDYKLSNTIDEAYLYQLHVYHDYIKQITNLPINTYLISILKNRVNKISLKIQD